MPVTRSEQFVAELSARSFLSLWSTANPENSKGKELCDLAVVFDNIVILLSVKEIAFGQGGSDSVNHSRWHKAAVEESIAQLLGGFRNLQFLTQIKSKEKAFAHPVPRPEHRVEIGVVVAICGGRAIKLVLADQMVKGRIVHVMDETSLKLILEELDTTTDFAEYFLAKETFLRGSQSGVDSTTHALPLVLEEDLLGYYLLNGRSFPRAEETLSATIGAWSEWTKSPEYLGRKAHDEQSYFWDRLIEYFTKQVREPWVIDLGEHGQIDGGATESREALLRGLARVRRLGRRTLSVAFLSLFDEAMRHPDKNRALWRTVCMDGVDAVYVFLVAPAGIDREHVKIRLYAKCLLARTQHKSAVIVGLATRRWKVIHAEEFDCIRLEVTEVTAADEAAVKAFVEKGILPDPTRATLKKVDFQEYPE